MSQIGSPQSMREQGTILFASKLVMEHRQRNWKRLLKRNAPLLLPSASDALTAKLVEQAGFPAYQIGGFTLDGTRFGFPDMDVNRLGEKSAVVRDIVHASDLPVLVDCDDGYGDEKNVTHTIRTYDDLGVSAVFIEDQKSPKKCGHMGGKQVIDPGDMVNKLKAAQTARRDADKLFILARTDALAVNGLDDALRRAEIYLKAGADGVYVEGSETIQQLRTLGREFKGKPLAGLKAGIPMLGDECVTTLQFEQIVDIAYWKAVEQKAVPLGERVRQTISKIVRKAS